MSKLSFQTFCIEFYSKHIGMFSNEVYELFEREGILQLLEDEYEDLHGMGMEHMEERDEKIVRMERTLQQLFLH